MMRECRRNGEMARKVSKWGLGQDKEERAKRMEKGWWRD